MFRVVTHKFELVNGQRRQKITPGPWHPYRQWAENWESRLKRLGCYERVYIEEFGQKHGHETGHGR